MQKLRDISIGRKLTVLCGALLVAMCTVGLVGYNGIAGLRDANEKNGVHFGTIRSVLHARVALDTIRALVFWRLLAADHAQQRSMDELLAQLDEVWVGTKAYLMELQSLSGQKEIADTIALLQPAIDTYVAKGTEVITRAGQEDGETALRQLTEFEESFLQLSQAMELLSDMVGAEAAKTKAFGTKVGVEATHTTLWVLVGAVFFASLLGFVIRRSIVSPLAQVTTAAKQIARGNIHQHVDYQSSDEVGDLATAFRELIAYLREVADAADRISSRDLTVDIPSRSANDVLSQSFLKMVDTMRETVAQMQEGAHTLSTSIDQIMASSTALTASVNETATAVRQTSVTVEEAKQTAYISGKKATEIATRTAETARISQMGEHAVNDAVNGMSTVRSQMESIAQSVIQLGEQTHTINEIITTVSGLAEQSNLLAINAAIEAAKAGQAGKGFTVVAQEVRHLAEQSKNATAQVRTMLDDIRKAGATAILVTEQGVQSSDVATEQSLHAGESIRLLATSITEAAQSVTQIAASNQQQLVGMDQVAGAMDSIKHASEQNAQGMQQIEGAARDLHHVGMTLKALVEQYKTV